MKKSNVSNSGIENIVNSKLKELNDIVQPIEKVLDDSNVEFIDTGNYGLNRIISGSFFKGVPNNRIIIFYGENQTMKTYTALNICKNAKDYDIYILDSEGSILSMVNNIGIDKNKIKYIPVYSIEDFNVKVKKVFNTIIEIKKSLDNPDNYKAIVVLDSLGGLITEKIIEDVDGKVDRGNRARMINDCVKSITMKSFEYKIPFIILNHVYDDPAAMYQSKIKNQSGGKGIMFLSRLIIQCNKSLVKSELKTEDKVYSGISVDFMTIKNYLVQPGLTCTIDMDFNKGMISKYSGILDLAIKYKFIDNSTKGWYTINKEMIDTDKIKSELVDKKYRLTDILFNDNIWNMFLEKLDKLQYQDIRYSSIESNNNNNAILTQYIDNQEDNDNTGVL
mgnify:CR=1 FL=1